MLREDFAASWHAIAQSNNINAKMFKNVLHVFVSLKLVTMNKTVGARAYAKLLQCTHQVLIFKAADFI